MSEGVTVLAIIPARAGSKGIRNKNFRPLAGLSPLGRALAVANALGVEPVISSDVDIARHQSWSGEAACQDRAYRLLARPAALAQDDTPMIDVVKHVLDQIPGPPEQIVVLLQPTQPLRTPEHIKQAIALLASSGADSVVSVVEIPRTHHRQVQAVVVDGQLEHSWRRGPSCRQHLSACYIRDGSVYAFRRDTVTRWDDIYGVDTRPLIIDPAETCPLDTEADWIEAERRVRERAAEA